VGRRRGTVVSGRRTVLPDGVTGGGERVGIDASSV
jgi:hypothetical protein